MGTNANTALRHSNIVCRQEFSAAHREELALRLRTITGWEDLSFQSDGTISAGADTPSFGSQTARNLIRQAQDGKTVFVLEDASNRNEVAFARVVPGTWKGEPNNQIPVYVILIDFADFDRLRGDEAALNAFNVGWALLHELEHAANDLQDSTSLNEQGECEEKINQMRRECNLPERSEYFSTLFPHSEETAFMTRLARLAFDQTDPVTHKHRRYWIIWDATLVGGLPEPLPVARVVRKSDRTTALTSLLLPNSILTRP